METKEVVVNGKSFTIKELLAVDVEDINWEDKKEAVKKQILLSTGMSETDYSKLTIKERLALIKGITELNFGDFQKPNPSSEQN